MHDLQLQDDGTFVTTTPGMRWRRPRPEQLPTRQRAVMQEVGDESAESAEPAARAPAVPPPQQPRARVHSRSPSGAPYLPGEGPPVDA